MSWTKYINPNKYKNYFSFKFLTYRLLLKTPIIVKRNFSNHEIKFSVASNKELWRANNSFYREPITMEWISDFIGQDDAVIDIGANIGAYSLLIAIMKKNSFVYAIEPESSNFYSLNRNIIANKLSHKIMPLCLAIGEKNSINTLFLSRNEPGSALHSIERPESEGESFLPTHNQGIIEYTFDSLINQIDNLEIKHVKIDVDGFEDKVINGAIDFLKNSKCKTILIEAYEKTVDDVNNILLLNGFSEYKRDEWHRPNGIAYNILYTK